MVGSASNSNRQASFPANPDFHWRRLTCNFGRRIDCFAWGDSVYSTDPSGTLPMGYSPTFSGTSSAAAIIAGAALVIQAIAEKNLNNRLAPAVVRKLLSDETGADLANPLTNTPTDAPAIDQIRVMPNLRAIAARMLDQNQPVGAPPQGAPPQIPVGSPQPVPKRPKQKKKPKQHKKSKQRKPH
jgi:hypothetical protein